MPNRFVRLWTSMGRGRSTSIPESRGEEERWFDVSTTFSASIEVPGAWDAQGFGEETEKLFHSHVGKGWYRRQVAVPEAWAGRRTLLSFGGVYREAQVWVDGKLPDTTWATSPTLNSTSRRLSRLARPATW